MGKNLNGKEGNSVDGRGENMEAKKKYIYIENKGGN